MFECRIPCQHMQDKIQNLLLGCLSWCSIYHVQVEADCMHFKVFPLCFLHVFHLCFWSLVFWVIGGQYKIFRCYYHLLFSDVIYIYIFRLAFLSLDLQSGYLIIHNQYLHPNLPYPSSLPQTVIQVENVLYSVFGDKDTSPLPYANRRFLTNVS